MNPPVKALTAYAPALLARVPALVFPVRVRAQAEEDAK
jgi:hypothetical protein